MANQKNDKLDPLQQSMVNDFTKLLATSSPLFNAYMDLTADQKAKVENHYLEWAWQMIFAATTAKDTKGAAQEDVMRYYKQFGGFILQCQQGKEARFLTKDWAAFDRRQYDYLSDLRHKTSPRPARNAILNFYAIQQGRSLSDVLSEYRGTPKSGIVDNTLYMMVEKAVAETISKEAG